MSDNKKHIDDLFREEFNGFELPVNSADFQAIQSGLAKKRRKRPILWWFIFVLLAGTTAFFMADFGRDSSASDDVQNSTESIKQERTAQNSDNPSANNQKQGEQVEESSSDEIELTEEGQNTDIQAETNAKTQGSQRRT